MIKTKILIQDRSLNRNAIKYSKFRLSNILNDEQ